MASVLGITTAVLESVNTATLGSALSAEHIGWHFGLNILTNLSFFAAVRSQYLQTRFAPVRRPVRRSYSRMPYGAVAASYGLLVWVLLDGTVRLDTWVVVTGAIISSALVVARQLVTFADNDNLLAQLNSKVAELAEAVEERDTLARSLRYLAYHDNLTGLANRTLFLERLTTALSDRRVRPTVVMIDLDDFKPVNDDHGHHAGDQLLRVIGERLTECVREGDTVARLGGDEFALVLRGEIDIPEMLQRIQAAVSEPIAVGPATVQVRASLGTATARPGDDVTTLLHEADLEMYADKQLSKR
jgi:diguanylate cyclase (GGDEF)-like protein